MVRLAQTVHLSCTDTNTISKRSETGFHKDPRHIGVPSAVSKPISEPMVRSAQTVHLYGTEVNTVSKQTEIRFYMTHVT